MSRLLPVTTSDVSASNAQSTPLTEPAVLGSLDNIMLQDRICAQSSCCRKRKTVSCASEPPLAPYHEHKAAAGEVLLAKFALSSLTCVHL